jgi:hypothetical protein
MKKISTTKNSDVNFVQFLVIKTLDPYWILIRIWIGIQPKMLDPEPDSMNPDPEHWFTDLQFSLDNQLACTSRKACTSAQITKPAFKFVSQKR